MKKVDVLIVGAGPTGLTMAIECLRHGLTCHIIDCDSEPTPYSKATAIQARTIEVLQRMGLHQKFLSEGEPIHAVNMYCNVKCLAHIKLNQISSPFPLILGLEQSKTEHILIEHLTTLGHKVERETTLISYKEQSDNSVIAKTEKGDIHATYLIGCDGSHSAVRKQMGCTFKGKEFNDIFSLADIKVHWDLPHDELHLFLEDGGVIAAFPLPGESHVRVVFQLPRLRGLLSKKYISEHGIIKMGESLLPKISEIEELLSSYLQKKVKVTHPKWIANFHINSRLSSSYRKDHIFLVGDAAHIHSPVGGQGMNTGIQDAFNLAWKIAYTHKNLSKNKNLLETYVKERRTLGEKLLKGTYKASKIVTMKNPTLLFLRRHLIGFVLSFPWLQKKLIQAISEVNIGYPEKRVPNIALIENGKEVDFYSHTEKSTKYHLILFNIDDPPINNPNVEVLFARKQNETKALLVRPDGFLAVEDSPPFAKLKKYEI